MKYIFHTIVKEFGHRKVSVPCQKFESHTVYSKNVLWFHCDFKTTYACI